VSQARFSQDYPPLEMATFTSEGRGKFIWLKKRGGQGSKASVTGLKKQIRKAAGRNKSGDDFWVREDGALCWGCDVHAFAEAVGKTIGKGGRTNYRINDD